MAVAREADAVVIGAGALGLSVALHLAARGLKRVTALDQYQPGSQASCRAAGLFKLIQPDAVRTAISRSSIEEMLDFEQRFRVPLRVERSGSLMIARTSKHAALVRSEVEASRAWGIDVELVDGREAHRLAPYLEGEVLAAAYCPGDVYIEEPASLIRAYLDAAQQLGVSLGDGMQVMGITVQSGRVEGVETPSGPIAAPIVVDAAGVWARLVGHLAGADVPVSPVRHQLSITEPIAGIEAAQPIVRIVDAAVYVRPARGGLMLGGFEADPLPIAEEVADPSFEMSRLPLDVRVLDLLSSAVESHVPALHDARVAEHRGGGFTMTPDGRFLVGPVPGLPGFWTATGCNGSGFSSSPALGDVLAEWIIDGRPSLDVAVLLPQRFSGTVWSEDDLCRKGIWQYAHYYDPMASTPAVVGS